MSKRTELLRDQLLEIDPEICPERAVLLTQAWRESAGQPLLVRRAKAFARVLGEMSIYIRPGELIVGNQARQPRAAPIFPEYAVRWIGEEIDDLPNRPIDRFAVRDDARAALGEVVEFWRGQTYHDRVESTLLLALPPVVLAAYDARLASYNQVVSNLSRLSTGDGHIIVDYARVMAVGLNALIAEARERRAGLDPGAPDTLERTLFYEAVEISLQAAIAFAERFATLAEAQAAVEPDPLRRAELAEIAAVCRRVPAYPARTFHEAVQAYWFAHLLLQIEANGHSISPGRFDQYLYPYYAADVAAGRVDRAGAVELVESFYLKCAELNKVREWNYTQYMSGYPMFQTLSLGGQARDGQDATNDLSYICLEAAGNMRLPQPTVVVRVHDGSPEEFLLESARCLLRHGGGMPGFFNDEVAIPLLMRIGVSLEDARDWAVMGCSEPQVAGKFNTGTGGVSHINLVKVLEIALNGGENPRTDLRPCRQERDLATFTSFEEVLEAFRVQLRYYLRVVPLLDNLTSLAYTDLTPTPFLSALVEGRIETGRDISLGGPPNYHNLVLHAYGLANVVNSLAAVRKLVFEEHRLTGAQLSEALASNFAWPGGEEIRQMLLNRAPKFGNDDPTVDGLSRRVVHELVSITDTFRPVRGGRYGASTQSLTANVPSGAKVGATPDGRRAGEPLADNNSPAPGSDVHGPTAVLRSVAAFDHTVLGNGTILNLKFHPSALDGAERMRKFTALIRAFFDLKGFQVQFNVVDAALLRDAQAHPENYRNLVVKVAGYSALFCSLDRKLQDQIIARTAHDLG